MDPLKRVHERGAVDLLEDVLANLNDVVGSDSQDAPVEGPVVNRAHGDAVRHDWFAAIRVLSNVCCLQELSVSQMA